MGAADAYFAGWSEAGPAAQAYLNDLAKSVAPYLEDIDLTGAFSDDARAQMEAAFGSSGTKAAAMEYAEAYAGLRQAVERLDEAKARQAMVVGSGDQAAIDAAQEELDLANEGEVLARRRMVSAQMRLSAEARAQMQLANAIKRQTDATKERGRAEEDAARKAADREAEAERRRQEAEAKRIADARLRWELAQQDTAGQIGIWQRELTGVEEGSAEYYDILTRIIGLEDRLRREREGAGGGGFLPSADEGEEEVAKVIEHFKDIEAYFPKRDIWSVIREVGRKGAQELWTGFTDWTREKIDEVTLQWANELTSGKSLDKARNVGAEWGTEMVHDLINSFTNPENAKDRIDVALPDHMRQAESPLVEAAGTLGRAFADGFAEAFKAEWDAAGGFWGVLGITRLIERIKQGTANALEDAADTVFGRSTKVTGGSATQGHDHQTPVSAFARGTGLYPGGWGVVGEEGPELVKLPSGSQILPADETARAMGGNSVVIEAGAIVIQAPNGKARDVEIGVRRALKAAGVAG